jgi:transposase
MNKLIPEIKTQDIDHLGIVAGIVDEIGIVEIVNARLGRHSLEKVSAGHVVKAMILNCMGFLTAPLYLFSQFFVGKATEHLIGEGVLPEHLNDDRLGRVLDDLHQKGLTKIFIEIAIAAAKKFQIDCGRLHLDGSSFHVHGEYKNPTESNGNESTDVAGKEVIIKEKLPENSPAEELKKIEESTTKSGEETEENTEEKIIEITYGYSRDHRPDLKQYLINIISSSDGDIPLFFHAGDGNDSEKSRFPLLIQEFKRQWTSEEIEVFVADSALYSAENITTLGELPWISRVPLTIDAAHQLVETLSNNEFDDCQISGYRISEQASSYGGVAQRWLVVESATRRASDLQQWEKQLSKQEKTQLAALKKLSNQQFNCQVDALNAAHKLAIKMKYHQLDNIQVVQQAHYLKSGRPSCDQTPDRITYHLQADLVLNTQVVTAVQNSCGRFIIATNLTDIQSWTPTDILQEYKQQAVSERGFKFLKDPIFFTSSIFVKSAKRVAALAMIMTLCLLVYTLAQRQLRSCLVATNETIPNQLGKPTQSPTLRWVFQCFQAVHLVLVSDTKIISNLTQQRKFILQFLGAACQKYYLLC